MATFNTQGISLYYEVYGNPTNPPVLLIAGLGGTRRTHFFRSLAPSSDAIDSFSVGNVASHATIAIRRKNDES